MAKVSGHNYYFDLFEETEPDSAVYTESSPASATWTRRGRQYYTVAEIDTVTVAKVEANEVDDLIYGNEQG